MWVRSRRGIRGSTLAAALPTSGTCRFGMAMALFTPAAGRMLGASATGRGALHPLGHVRGPAEGEGALEAQRFSARQPCFGGDERLDDAVGVARVRRDLGSHSIDGGV